MSETSKGLAGVTAADTSLSDVDGDNGRLIYLGYDIRDLGANATFEEVVYLLWNGHLPNQDELDIFKAELKGHRALPVALLEMMQLFPKDAHPMAVLRTAVSALGMIDPTADAIDLPAARAKALHLTAIMPTIVAAWERLRNGQAVVDPRDDLDHAANFLHMLMGEKPNPDGVRALDAYLVLLADHGFNASTFAARVTTGTQADMYSAITSALGTLKGASHGGANQRAMEQFLEAGAENTEAWYHHARETGKRIMGIGHREYKVEDPRAGILRPLAEKFADSSGQGKWFDVANTIERLARKDNYFVERNLYANVDYYSAVVLYTIGIPIDQFTCLFAISRVAGWTAHVIEQLNDNRLIRPKARYIGGVDLKYTPIAERN